MANYANLKATINANIKANGAEEITGPILNNVLNAAVNALGAGWQYMGVATPATSPGTPDANVFYIASTAGTYTNFGSLVVAEGEVAILKYNGSWAKEVTGAATAAQVTQLGQKVDELAQGKFYGYFSDADELPAGDVPGFAYVGTAAPFAIYNFDGSDWSDSGLTIDEIPIGNGDDIDTDADGKLQFANRVYNAQQPNGMGYKILRKDKTFAEQVTDANTVYEIRYEFDLDGDEVTIPAGCVLNFAGGQLSNGTIVGQATRFSGDLKHIFAESITPSGTFDIPYISTNFFATLAGDNALRKVFALSSDDVYNRIEIEDGNYYFNLTTEAEAGIRPKSNSDVCIDGTLIIRPNSLSVYEIIQPWFSENITLFGSGTLQGDKGQHGVATEFGHCIQVNTCKNVTIKGLTLIDPIGDGMAIHSSSEVNVINVTIKNAHRNGISIGSSYRVTIDGCTIDGVSGTAPQYGIDIEPNANETQEGIIIRNCKILNCAGYSIGGLAPATSFSGLTIIENCYTEKTLGMGFNGLTQLNIRNVHSADSGIYLANCVGAIISGLQVDDSDYSSTIISSNVSIRDSIINSTKNTSIIIESSEISTDNCVIKVMQLISNQATLSKIRISKCDIFAGIDIPMKDGSVISDSRIVFDKGSEYTPAWVVRVASGTEQNGVTFSNNVIEVSKDKNYVFVVTGKCSFIDNKINILAGTISSNVFMFYSPVIYGNNEIKVSSGATASLPHRFYDAATLEASEIRHSVIRCTTATRPSLPLISNRLYNINIGDTYFDETIGKEIVWLGTLWANVDGSPLLATSGATSARPSATTAGAGYTYFDTDLGKMIVSNGTTWVNMDGTALA